jgi:hypothetical protein
MVSSLGFAGRDRTTSSGSRAGVRYVEEVEPPLAPLCRDRRMYRRIDPPTSENELYLKLFITNGGGW